MQPKTVAVQQTLAEAALATLKAVVAQARSVSASGGQPSRGFVSLSVTQQVGTAVTDRNGGRALFYTRLTGKTGVVSAPALSVNA